jgi:hypothetical protein
MVRASEKLAATKDRFTVAQTRTGRRPMRVETMLKKDQEGTLYKKAALRGKLFGAVNPGSHAGEAVWEVGGLGMLASPYIDKYQAKLRARLAGEHGEEAEKKRTFMPEWSHDATELGGLGVLAVPSAVVLKRHFMTKGASEGFWASFDDELEKMGEDPNQVSWWEARKALNAYKRMQEETPDPRNVAGYAAMGALIGPARTVLKNRIEGKTPQTDGAKAFKEWQQARFGLQTPIPVDRGPLTFRNAPQRAVNSVRRAGLGGSTARKYLASSIGGAAFMGAMPFVKHQVEKKMQERTLKKYLQQQRMQPQVQQGAL